MSNLQEIYKIFLYDVYINRPHSLGIEIFHRRRSLHFLVKRMRGGNPLEGIMVKCCFSLVMHGCCRLGLLLFRIKLFQPGVAY